MIRKPQSSIRFKILVLLLVIPVVSLTFFLMLASGLFVQDKITYVFDSTAQNATTLASEVKTSYNSFQQELRPILGQVNIEKLSFNPRSQQDFLKQRIIEYLFLYSEKENDFVLHDQLRHPRREIRKLQLDKDWFQNVLRTSLSSKQILVDLINRSRFFVYSQKINDEQGRNILLVAILKIPELYEAFSTPGLYSSYLVNSQQDILIRPKYWRASQKDLVLNSTHALKPAFSQGSPQGVFRSTLSKGKDVLVAYSKTDIPGFFIFSLVDEKLALQTYEKFLVKSTLYFLCVLSLIMMIGLLVSKKVTLSIQDLVEMTKEIAKGNFSIAKRIKTNDEIEDLANNVISMGQNIHNLLEERVEHTRMETELGMVNAVQKNLFPPLSFSQNGNDLECRMEAATEAGGDWFHYSVAGDKVIIWIGDATGHGAPAALVTAAAKATSSILELEDLGSLPPSFLLHKMNHAICSTAKGSVMMTFFVAIVDLKTGEIQYSNASHELPMVIPRTESLHRRDIKFLADVNGKRLGEDKDYQYKDASYQLKHGDTLVFYTDGITDLENREGRVLGEGRFVRTLAKIKQYDSSASDLANDLQQELSHFRKDVELKDDLMYIVYQYNKTAS
jgi:sigma-B regulation protein RsbU (phosphoserine phosphatase)